MREATTAHLVAQLHAKGVLRTPAIKKAFSTIDRADFLRLNELALAYRDDALPIGYGQTISQPFTVAFMLELLRVREGEVVLDVGSGSGWTTALLAVLVGGSGRVIGVERIPELVQFGQANLAQYDLPQAEIRAAGDALGLPEAAPFDRILVSAAAAKLPRPLVDQLKVGGVMVIPISDAIWRVEKKTEGEVSAERHGGFAFVPLIEQ